ncbi:hypothetical protein SRHO_G00077470 [Serrasalmus rhombeus]
MAILFQNGVGVWGEESDSSRGRGEASRDFAKLYELDSDPNRKEFLDDLFTFMQKRGKMFPSDWLDVPVVSSPTVCRVTLLAEDASPSLLAARAPSLALALGPQQVAGLARAATLEQLREKLETGVGAEGPERKMARLAEEQQRLMQQAFQHNLLAMASQMPMNLRLSMPPREDKHDLAMSISSSGAASISVSVEVNGVLYSGTLFAQKSAATPVSASAAANVHPMAPSAVFSFPSHSPSSSSSSKGPSSVEPSASSSP